MTPEHAPVQHRWHAVRAGPVRDATGVIVAWIGTCFDVEEERESTASVL